MNRCSYFVEKRALFGPYPSQDTVRRLQEEVAVDHFVDLTDSADSGVSSYVAKNVIRYPIEDHGVPSDLKSFAVLILKLIRLIKHSSGLIYVHCKGGHGRSGVVVACVLAQLHDINSSSALKLTGKFHNERVELSEKWRHLDTPLNHKQRVFVHNFFKPIYFYRPYSDGPTAGFSAFSIHSVNIPSVGFFQTAEGAYQAHKELTNEKYVKKQCTAFSPIYSKKIGHECVLRPDWMDVRVSIMSSILEHKFRQHTDIREALLNTGLKPIVEHCPDAYWGDGIDGRGKNVMGKLLCSVRYKLAHELI